jgi:hypothetical protein
MTPPVHVHLHRATCLPRVEDLVPVLERKKQRRLGLPPTRAENAKAKALQWELVEPVNPTKLCPPPIPSWMHGGASAQDYGCAFDLATGLPDDLLAEQLLASDLWAEVESQGQRKTVKHHRQSRRPDTLAHQKAPSSPLGKR